MKGLGAALEWAVRYAAVAKLAGWRVPHAPIRPAYLSGCIWAIGGSRTRAMWHLATWLCRLQLHGERHCFLGLLHRLYLGRRWAHRDREPTVCLRLQGELT